MIAPRRGRLAGAAPALLALAASACAGPCSPAPSGPPDAAAPAPPPSASPRVAIAPAGLPDVAPTFAPIRSQPLVAMPERCAARAPALRAPLPGPSRVIADPASPGAALVGLVGPGGAAPSTAMALAPDGPGPATPRPVAWPAPSPPLVARTAAGGWLLATALPGATTAARVAIARGDHADLLGQGDGFEPVDLACSAPAAADAGLAARRCALLTTRLAGVAAPGADLWLFDDAAGTPWTRLPLGEAEDAGHGHPVGLARAPDAAGRGAVAVLLADGALAFWEASRDGARAIGSLPAPFGLLDAIAAPTPLAMTYGARHDEAGCTDDGGRLRFERAAAPPVELRTPTPPLSGWLRPLERGYLAAWIAPLVCGGARRVLFAVVLDGAGAPIDAPTAIADAGSAAVSVRGGEVDLWIAHDDALSWVRARCGAP